MARFTILHCRKIKRDLSEFDVRILKDAICEGDAFSFRSVLEHKDFKVLSIRQTPEHTTLVCAGSLDYDDEITNTTLDTKVVRLPPADLPTPTNPPTPHKEEEEFLKMFIEDWETRAPVQRAICVCINHGLDTPEDIGSRLGITRDDVLRALTGLSGVLYDSNGNKLHIR
jgi:hypothetical protein